MNKETAFLSKIKSSKKDFKKLKKEFLKENIDISDKLKIFLLNLISCF